MVAATCLSLNLSVSAAYAQHSPFDDFPIVITCEQKGTQHAYYLSRVTQDGTATYVASERIAGTISLGGHAKAVGGPAAGSCVGKTLEELRASGQAHDLRR
ncbi:hypothetical protein [Rhizobium mayense]|uniref:Uncharacterized protein n=1 Tax=Rhizobium mayense TaxID=1312184 RepID=A0ABT7JR78_9HYPH|nr:hypothetical protein [Rhizobium mayense]MDL2398856.1 hypothetical protein [Rhizobium mayense]